MRHSEDGLLLGVRAHGAKEGPLPFSFYFSGGVVGTWIFTILPVVPYRYAELFHSADTKTGVIKPKPGWKVGGSDEAWLSGEGSLSWAPHSEANRDTDIQRGPGPLLGRVTHSLGPSAV